MFQVVPARGDAPAFCTPLGNPIIYWTFNNFIKDIIDRTGLMGDKYSTEEVDAPLLQHAACRIGNL